MSGYPLPPHSTDATDGQAAFEIIGGEVLSRGFIDLDRFSVRQRLMRGGWTAEITREIAAVREVSAVILYDPDLDQVVLTQQMRLVAQMGGFAPVSTEIVAGLIEPGETPVAMALREVAEESGCTVIGDLVPMFRLMMSPGNMHQPVNFFCGRVDASTAKGFHGLAEEDEEIRVLAVDYAAFREALLAGRYENAPTVAAGYWLYAHREMLRDRWLGAK